MAELFTGGHPALHAEQLLKTLPAWQLESKKSDFLDWLYALYDRDNAPLGLKGTYTGLWQQYQRDLAQLSFAAYAATGVNK